MKTCSKCGIEKRLDEFTKDRRRKSGVGGTCQACKNANDWRRNGGRRPERASREPDLRFLSLGAGVQSSTLLMMSNAGHVPRLDFAVFADTGWEPDAVYRNLEWLQEHSDIPVHVVSAGNVRDDSLVAKDGFISIPAFTSNHGMLIRQCTYNYKIAPIRSFVYNYIGRKARNTYIHQWLGISSDESHRMNQSEVMWIDFQYPLVDLGISRGDCKKWMTDSGYPEPPRSACVGCPYRSGAEWKTLTRSERSDAESFDSSIRHNDDLTLYLHYSRTPLSEAVPDDHDGGWGNECSGMCGV